jgi:hypothetical protein
MTREEETKECYSCGYENLPIKVFDEMEHANKTGEVWMCAVCANSMIGHSCTHPTYRNPDARVLQAIGYCTNAILDRLGTFDEWRKSDLEERT